MVKVWVLLAKQVSDLLGNFCFCKVSIFQPSKHSRSGPVGHYLIRLYHTEGEGKGQRGSSPEPDLDLLTLMVSAFDQSTMGETKGQDDLTGRKREQVQLTPSTRLGLFLSPVCGDTCVTL